MPQRSSTPRNALFLLVRTEIMLLVPGGVQGLMTEEEVRRLQERLEAAETVCMLFGWTGGGNFQNSDRYKATLQAWMDWAGIYGHGRKTPEWDQRIAELAARRDAKRAETLAKLTNYVEE